SQAETKSKASSESGTSWHSRIGLVPGDEASGSVGMLLVYHVFGAEWGRMAGADQAVLTQLFRTLGRRRRVWGRHAHRDALGLPARRAGIVRYALPRWS